MSNDELRTLAEAATPGPWQAHTFGHRSVRSAAGAVTKALFDVPVSADVRSLMTDLSWVQTDDLNIALTGNGPKQTENAAWIAACSPDRILALLGERDALSAALDDSRKVIDAWVREYDALLKATA